MLWYWNTQTFPEHEAYKQQKNVWVKKQQSWHLFKTNMTKIWQQTANNQTADKMSVVLTICRASWWQWSGPRLWSSDNHWYTDSPTYNSKLISCITEKNNPALSHSVNKLCCLTIKKSHHLIPMVILAYFTRKTMSFWWWWWWSPCLF